MSRPHVGVSGALFVAAALALAACSNSTPSTSDPKVLPTTGPAATSPGTVSGSSVAPGGTAPGTTSSAGTSTTVKPTPQAQAAVLTAGDLGGQWREYPAGSPVVGEKSEGCGEVKKAALPADSVSGSEILQLGDRLSFVRSTSYVFPDVASAEAHLRLLTSPDMNECRRAVSARAVKDFDPPMSVVLKEATVSKKGEGYRGVVDYTQEQAGPDGTPQVVGVQRHLYYVKGKTLIDVFDEAGAKADDPPGLSDQVAADLNAAMAVVLARVAA